LNLKPPSTARMVFLINDRIVIFANGVLPDVSIARKLIREDDILIAADAGARHILEMDLMPKKAIGDFDSITADNLFKLESAGVELIRYPSDKDKTDLDLAIDLALEEGARNILVLAALGGRLDMILSNITLLTRPDLKQINIRLDDGFQEVFIILTEALIEGIPGDQVSLIPWGGAVHGVVTQGLHWPLKNESLEPSTSRGISNELIDTKASVSINSGALLCIHQRISR
jgi:thiamine pyrophosphokinase